MILTTIDGIPLWSSQNEALNWAAQNGLSGFHTHAYEGTIGYMGGQSHEDSISNNTQALIDGFIVDELNNDDVIAEPTPPDTNNGSSITY
jgi:hypothetical protein